MAAIQQVSLLGIPREVRQRIYDYAAHLDLEFKPVRNYQHKFAWGDGFYTSMVKAPDESFSVLWINLMLVCRSIRTELAAYMDSAAFLGVEENRTYVMDYNVLVLRGPIQWHTVPCRPSKTTAVTVNIISGNHHPPKFFVGGDATHLLGYLFQTLNWLLHYGPLITRASPLSPHLKLKTLRLNIVLSAQLPENLKKDDEIRLAFKSVYVPVDYHEPPQQCAGWIRNLIQLLRAAGLLLGYVDQVSVYDTEGLENIVDMEDTEDTHVPSAWKMMGFQWGLDARREIEISRNEGFMTNKRHKNQN